MKHSIVGLGLLVSASTLAVPERANAGVRVDVGIALGQPTYVAAGNGSRDASRYGYERGQREGTERGYDDGRKGRRFDIVRDADYRDADDGYKGWMGSRRAYADAFQRGFAEGYRRSFERGREDRRNRDDRRRGYDDDRNDRGRDRW
jgi:hypothetical protein